MGLFAATPPLEALKFLISEAASFEKDEDLEDTVMMINGVARAFFEAPVTRDVCVDIPNEDKAEQDGDVVGILLKSLYGTRDAAMNFQKEIQKFMTGIGFTIGKYNISTYLHAKKKLNVMVHGDDFVSVGNRDEAAWFKHKFEEQFSIKTTVV